MHQDGERTFIHFHSFGRPFRSVTRRDWAHIIDQTASLASFCRTRETADAQADPHFRFRPGLRPGASRDAGMTRLEAFWTRMKTILLILAVCSLCSKAIVHTWRHFNPPPPPIVGP
jgi:hypothetical protein